MDRSSTRTALLAALLVAVLAGCGPAGSGAITPTPVVAPSSGVTGSPAPSAHPPTSVPPSPAPPSSAPPSPPGTLAPSDPPSRTPQPPTPAPATPPGGGPSAIVTHGDRDSTQVALIFTMGGRAETVIPIVEWLRDNRVPATIFVAGSVIDSRWTDVGRRTLEIMEANQHLFGMASHGYNHPDMRTLTEAQIAEEIRAVERTLAARGARDPRPFFQPPSGYQDAQVLRVAGSLGYRYTVLWDIDPLDWKTVEDGGPTADDIVAKVVGRAQGGSIVLLHLSGTQTLAALPRVVTGLRAKGLEPALLRDMLP
jgi:hypothetical protein